MPSLKRLPCLALAAPALLLGHGLCAAPKAPAHPHALPKSLRGHSYRVDQMPDTLPTDTSRRTPGDVIPPCTMVFGYTTQGPTDADGHLLRGPLSAQPHYHFTTAPAKPQH